MGGNLLMLIVNNVRESQWDSKEIMNCNYIARNAIKKWKMQDKHRKMTMTLKNNTMII